MQESDALTILRLYAIKRAYPIEGLFDERGWQFAQASCRETGFLRTCEQCRIGIRGNDRERNAIRTGTRNFQFPKDFKCEGLLATPLLASSFEITCEVP